MMQTKNAEVDELKSQLLDAEIIGAAAIRAHEILSNAIMKALELKQWPNFHRMYGAGLMAEGKARLLLEEVAKLREKVNCTKKNMKYRIRENVLRNARYLKRDGEWGTWKEAAKFSTQEAGTKFVETLSEGVHYYGFVTHECDLNITVPVE